MFLSQLSLINFKNYSQIEVEFSSKINCFVGNNGVGKTNLIDAIYYLSMCKSYSNYIDNQNIKFNEPFFAIQGKYVRNEQNEEIYCGFKRNEKKHFKRNKKDYQKLSEHIGFLPIVMISPADSKLITEGSDERRRFIDSVVSQYDREYLELLMRYNKVVEQRNQILKNWYTAPNTEMLELWNEQLIRYGVPIYKKRQEFINQLIPIFQNYYNFISDSQEQVRLEYQSQLNATDFEALLLQSAEKEHSLGYSSVGIHKDDLALLIENLPIKRIGSQGQQKTFLVALKFAQFDFMKQISGNAPILLLDDIFDKLDALRVKRIVNLVAENHFGQIFITDTNSTRMHEILSTIEIDYQIFTINKEGAVKGEGLGVRCLWLGFY